MKKARSKKDPSPAQIAGFFEDFYAFTREHIEPQMRQSQFVMVPMLPGYEDLGLALQVGLALIMEKPLLILALKGVWIPPRLRALADAVVDGESIHDPETKARMEQAVRDVMTKYGIEGVKLV